MTGGVPRNRRSARFDPPVRCRMTRVLASVSSALGAAGTGCLVACVVTGLLLLPRAAAAQHEGHGGAAPGPGSESPERAAPHARCSADPCARDAQPRAADGEALRLP